MPFFALYKEILMSVVNFVYSMDSISFSKLSFSCAHVVSHN